MLQRTIDRLLGRKPQRKAAMWMQDHLPDAKWLQQHLPDAKWLQARLPDAKVIPASLRKEQDRALNMGVGLSSPLWPTFIAAAGAGVAFWWWTQWARGKAEAEAREDAAIAEGAAHPETVMAHAPAPEPTGPEPVSPSDAKLAEPVEDILEHRPPEGETSAAALNAGAGLDAPLSDEAVATVDESLGVQGAAAKPRAPRKRKAPAAQPTTH